MSRELEREDTLVHDVIIAGAGPVGLFLACELRLAKLSVLVLEQLGGSALAPEAPPLRNARTLGSEHRSLLPARTAGTEWRRSHGGDEGGPGQPRPGSMASGPQRRGPAGHFAGIQFDYGNIDSSRWTYRVPGPADTHAGARDGAPRARPRRSRALRRSGDPARAAASRASSLRTTRSPSVPASDAFVPAGSWVATAAAARSASRVASSSSAPSPSSRDIRSRSNSPTRREAAPGPSLHADRHVHPVAARDDRDCRLRRRRIPSHRTDHARARAGGLAARLRHRRDPRGVDTSPRPGPTARSRRRPTARDGCCWRATPRTFIRRSADRA